MSGLHKVLNKMIGVWHYDEQALGSEHGGVLNMLELRIKFLMIDKVLIMSRVMNMPVLYKILQKMAHHPCLTEFWEFFKLSIYKAWIYKGCQYGKVTEGSL